MRKSLIVIIAALAILTGCGMPEFKEYRSPGGGFTVDMPGTPKEEEQTSPTAVGDIKTKMATCEGHNYGFTVAYSEFPQAAVENTDPKTMLEGARDGAVSNVKGKLDSSSMIEVEGHPAMELSFTIPDKKMKVKARLVLVGNRLYQILAGQPEGSAKPEEMDRFLNSFKLVKS